MPTPLIPVYTPQTLADPLVTVARVGTTGDVYRCLVAGKQVFQGTQVRAKEEEAKWQAALASALGNLTAPLPPPPAEAAARLALMVLEGA